MRVAEHAVGVGPTARVPGVAAAATAAVAATDIARWRRPRAVAGARTGRTYMSQSYFWCMSMPRACMPCSVRPAAPGGSGEPGGWERVPPERWGRMPCAYMVMV